MAIIGPAQPTQPACTSKWRCRFLCVRVFHTIWSINVQWNADNREKVGTWRNFPITNYLAIILSQKQCVLSYSTTFSTSFFLRGRLNLPGISFIDLILQFRGRINSLDFFFFGKKTVCRQNFAKIFCLWLEEDFFCIPKIPRAICQMVWKNGSSSPLTRSDPNNLSVRELMEIDFLLFLSHIFPQNDENKTKLSLFALASDLIKTGFFSLLLFQDFFFSLCLPLFPSLSSKIMASFLPAATPTGRRTQWSSSSSFWDNVVLGH